MAITRPGVYEYFVEFASEAAEKGTLTTMSRVNAAISETPQRIRSSQSGYFVVEPKLLIPDLSSPNQRELVLPLDGIVLQTLIPKWLPEIDHWPAHFKMLSDMGYNMVHFAPIQQRGASNSPYSIYEQLRISEDLFDVHYNEEIKMAKLNSMIQRIWRDWGILSVTDVVWNHTACNSPWLMEHPEAGMLSIVLCWSPCLTQTHPPRL